MSRTKPDSKQAALSRKQTSQEGICGHQVSHGEMQLDPCYQGYCSNSRLPGQGVANFCPGLHQKQFDLNDSTAANYTLAVRKGFSLVASY